jgi:hypothetical protein
MDLRFSYYVVKLVVAGLWPCSIAGFAILYHYYTKVGDNLFLGNVGNHLPDYTISHQKKAIRNFTAVGV